MNYPPRHARLYSLERENATNGVVTILDIQCDAGTSVVDVLIEPHQPRHART